MNSFEDLDPNSFYRTSDMALVTFLRMHGHSVQGVAWVTEQCYWIFRIGDNLLSLVDDFHEDRAKVNPKTFNRSYVDTKKELFEARRAAVPSS